MSRESVVTRFLSFNPYSRGFENRVTWLVAEGLRAPKDPIRRCITELLQQCAARERDDAFHPVQTIRHASDEIGQVVHVRERDPSPLVAYIERLPEPDRTIIELRMAGLNFRETALRLGLNELTVLETLSVRMAAMASIDAYAPPLKPSSAHTPPRKLHYLTKPRHER